MKCHSLLVFLRFTVHFKNFYPDEGLLPCEKKTGFFCTKFPETVPIPKFNEETKKFHFKTLLFGA